VGFEPNTKGGFYDETFPGRGGVNADEIDWGIWENLGKVWGKGGGGGITLPQWETKRTMGPHRKNSGGTHA